MTDTPNEKVSAILRALAVGEQRMAAAQREFLEAERVVQDVRRAYAEERPLTQVEHDAIVKRFEEGGELCCDKGLAWLRRVVPELWACAINEWAYEAVGCTPHVSDTTRVYWIEKVRNLRRDKFPRDEG